MIAKTYNTMTNVGTKTTVLTIDEETYMFPGQYNWDRINAMLAQLGYETKWKSWKDCGPNPDNPVWGDSIRRMRVEKTNV